MSDEPLKERIETWMVGQMPIIQMHGGESVVREANPETGEVVVELGGTCSHCGVSNITAQNIKADLIRDFEEVRDVVVRVPDTGEMTSDTVEGGRGGELQFSTEGSDHF
ncbi:NifU family protein [Salinigranum halophilum]|uniref:NifU family protein n=1 Tax=Salinigranum halophilum TaxID=2565931 RepID=UPI001F00BFB2|nr:NifU family protein [Salinigranum halophilum]